MMKQAFKFFLVFLFSIHLAFAAGSIRISLTKISDIRDIDQKIEENNAEARNNLTKLNSLISKNTKIPEGKGNFTEVLNPSFPKDSINNNFAFVGLGAYKQRGVYLSNGNGKLSMMVNQDTKIPDGAGYFTSFGELSLDSKNNHIAFIGQGILDQTGIYLHDGEKVIKIADQQTLVPEESNPFKKFTQIALEDNAVLFNATGSKEQQGIFLYTESGIFKVISTREKIDNKIIKQVTIEKNSFNQNQINVTVIFDDNKVSMYTVKMRYVPY